jgi:MATE family multidrug resistance protein
VGACCLEWWLYEGLILIAGWFPNADAAVAAMGIGFNTTALTYTISTGIAGAWASMTLSAMLNIIQYK